MNVVFMGTPDFAVPSLNALAKSGHTISLVVTQPDRPRGRGQKMIPSPVKQTAENLGIEVAQPERIKENMDFLRMLYDVKPDLIVVAAYGKILPEELINLPRFGCVNIHASLLPKYRGAAPVHRAVEAGERFTGVTLMMMSEGLDEGDMLDTRKTETGEFDTGELTDRLAGLGAEMLYEDLDALFEGRLVCVPQDDSAATYAPMVSKEEGHIDFSADSNAVLRKIRAMNPAPGAYAFLGDEKFKIFTAYIAESISDGVPGTVVKADSEGIAVATGSGTIVVEKVQVPGKKAMEVADFLRGYNLPEGTLLE